MPSERKPFPNAGRQWGSLLEDMRSRSVDDVDWRKGRTPLFVFFKDEETYDVGRSAFFEFFTENALGGKRAFFGLASMEKEVLDYGLNLFNAPDGAAGVFTSGGSESIFIAMKAARDALRSRTGSRQVAPLNLVIPISAHPAFDKAADAMDFEIRRAPLRPDRRVDAESMRALVDENTVALVGSAPCFPHGVIDPIDELSRVAEECGVWLHVDACVGGWIAPFFTSIGRPTPHFDFRYAGVRSLSADLHKFGFCPKPASTVFYRDADDLERATFAADSWPNGKFQTATLVGTRSGGAVAAAWAVLNFLGAEGYRDAATRLAEMTDKYLAGIRGIEGLETWAEPDMSIINYGSRTIDIFVVAEKMASRGWLPGLTRDPKGMHAMMSLLHEPVREEFISDLRQCVDEVKQDPRDSSSLNAIY